MKDVARLGEMESNELMRDVEAQTGAAALEQNLKDVSRTSHGK